MLIVYGLNEAWENPKTHTLRILSMGFGVWWAVVVLVLLLGVGNGFHNGVAQVFSKYGAKTMIIWGGEALVSIILFQ